MKAVAQREQIGGDCPEVVVRQEGIDLVGVHRPGGVGGHSEAVGSVNVYLVPEGHATHGP
jgi:hypothetical protein